jgi:hypothetical protein
MELFSASGLGANAGQDHEARRISEEESNGDMGGSQWDV